MSSDDGIYILKTKGPEYRVANLSAIDNLDYPDYFDGAGSMFAGCDVFTDEGQASEFARTVSNDLCDYTEYGITSLDYSDCEFPTTTTPDTEDEEDEHTAHRIKSGTAREHLNKAIIALQKEIVKDLGIDEVGHLSRVLATLCQEHQALGFIQETNDESFKGRQ